MNQTLNKAIELINTKYTHVLEFGVHTGRTIKQLRETLSKKYKIFGFDSFTGLPEAWIGTHHEKGAMSANGIIPDISDVIFYKGWFIDTIPEYKKIAKPIALLHIDCDLYSSTIDVLYGLKEYIVPGTIIVFDEWYYNHQDTENNRQHEQKAFFEWVDEFNIKFEEHPIIEDERKIITIL